MQTPNGFDRSAVEGQQNKDLLQDVYKDSIDLPKNRIITYSLEDDYGEDAPQSTKITPFNKDSVQKVPSEAYTHAGDYYGAASKIGRKLEANYYGIISI